MIHFYLNEQETLLEANASFTETLDQSLDSGSFSLPINSSKNPIAPMTPFRVYNDVTGENLYFVVIVDSVEVVSKNPLKCRHTLTVTQSSRTLCKHRLRNTVFNQPIISTINIPCNFMGVMKVVYNDGVYSYENDYVRGLSSSHDSVNSLSYTSPTVISPRARIKGSIKIHFDVKCLRFKTESGDVYENPDSWETMQSGAFYSFLIWVIKKRNGSYVGARSITMQGTEYEFTSSADIDFFADRDEYTTFEVSPYGYGGQGQLNIRIRDLVDDLPTPVAVKFSVVLLFTGKLTIETYNYSLLDVLKLTIKQARQQCTIGGDEYSTVYFEVPEDQFLDSIIAPDFDFTGMDLFEAVSEIFRFIDAVPTLTALIDDEYVYGYRIGYEFLNDNNGSVISNMKMADFKLSQSEEYYANKLMTVYQNCKQERAKFEPASKQFMNSSSNKLGIIDRSSLCIALKEPIDYIDQLWCYLGNDLRFTLSVAVYYGYSDPLIESQYLNMPKPFFDDGIDISVALFEKSIYSLLPVDGQETSFPNQSNTIYYEKGAKEIPLGDITNMYGEWYQAGFQTTNIQWAVRSAVACAFGFFHDDVPYSGTSGTTSIAMYAGGGSGADPDNTNFKIYARWRVKYHGVYDGQAVTVSNERRYDGEQMVSQVNSGAELGRLGVNLFGMVNKLGNEMFNITLPLTSFTDRVRKGQWFIDAGGNRYTANLVKTTIGTNENICMQSIQFVKNYNELSQFIRLNKEKRMYEIDTSITETGYENLVEYIECSTTSMSGYDDPTVFSTLYGSLNINSILTQVIFRGTLINDSDYDTSKKKVDYCVLEVFNKEADNDSIDLGQLNKSGYSFKGIYCPIHCYGFGNTLCFEIGYDNPINAGDRLDVKQVSGIDLLRGKTTLYANSEGYFDKVTVRFCWDNTDRWLSFYPLTEIPTTNVIGTISEYKYFKKPNESFHLNYQLAFVSPKSDVFFGEKFIKENAIIRNSSDKEGTVKTIKIYYSNSYLYSIIDKKGQGTVATGGSIQFNQTSDYSETQVKSLQIDVLFGTTVQYKSFAICDEDDNILIAGNRTGNSDHGSIYVYPCHKRDPE